MKTEMKLTLKREGANLLSENQHPLPGSKSEFCGVTNEQTGLTPPEAYFKRGEENSHHSAILNSQRGRGKEEERNSNQRKKSRRRGSEKKNLRTVFRKGLREHRRTIDAGSRESVRHTRGGEAPKAPRDCGTPEAKKREAIPGRSATRETKGKNIQQKGLRSNSGSQMKKEETLGKKVGFPREPSWNKERTTRRKKKLEFARVLNGEEETPERNHRDYYNRNTSNGANLRPCFCIPEGPRVFKKKFSEGKEISLAVKRKRKGIIGEKGGLPSSEKTPSRKKKELSTKHGVKYRII